MQGLVGEEHEELGVGAGGERSRSLTQVAAGLRVAVSDLTRSRALLPDPNSLRSGLARARFPRGRPGLWRPRPWRAGHASALTLSCYRDSRRRPGRARVRAAQPLPLCCGYSEKRADSQCPTEPSVPRPLGLQDPGQFLASS
ncbi:uncharacterized protein LOC117083969 isoform X2 [Trachypithecus francoisi]|uniref:uncharacterized protein LOC117083969 isoform X2 n=1 Tax=Trachypithecus francoisi TaxID=54180 RepID=UPI00141B13C9|nr:uncharacterized protein LOC117083969 isoform X2 [Trachypithecus francoisi]